MRQRSRPAAGKYRAYIDNWAATPAADGWKATVSYTGIGGGTRAPSKYTDGQYATYVGKLRRFVDNGGNLVLTDGALRALPGLFSAIKDTNVSRATSYTGQVSFTKVVTTAQDPKAEGNTLSDPLAKNVVQPGARFNTGLRRQTYEPTPVGFAIQDATGLDFSSAGIWQVARKPFEDAGGRVVGTSATSSPRGSVPVVDQVAYGELAIGKGVVRVLGAVLPSPTEQFDHQEGLEPFAVTYTGSYLAENITDWCAPGRNCINPATAGAGGPGSGAKACIASRSFRSAKVKGAGRGLRFSFKRSGTAPVHVDLFQVSKGRKVLTWNGRKKTQWNPTDGYYFARFRLKGASGFNEYKRITLRRKEGRWTRTRNFFGTETCGLLRQSKLTRPVFGGSNKRPLEASYLLSRTAPVDIVMTRGKKTVGRHRAKAAKGRLTHHVRLATSKLPRGLYRVTIKAGRGKSRMVSVMYSRKI